MRDKRPLSVRALTTGEAAKMLGVAPRTLTKWFDRGLLPGWKMPGSEDRRIFARGLAKFMRDRGLAVPAELDEVRPVLVYGLAGLGSVPDGCKVASDAVTAGYLVATERLSGAVIGDDEGVGAAVQVAALVRRHHPAAAILFVLGEDVPANALAEAGFGDCPSLPRAEAGARLPALLAG